MKVVFIIPSLSSGGAERIVSHISNKLAENNNDVYILTFEGIKPFYKLHNNIKYKTAGLVVKRENRLNTIIKIFFNLFKYMKFVAKEIKDICPDVVIPFLPQADISIFKLILKKRSYKIVCSERNDPQQRNLIMQRILKLIYSNCDLLVCQSKNVSNFYSNIPGDKKVIIENPLNDDIIPEYVDESSCPKIVSVGRLSKQKNHELLIRSFANIYRVGALNCNLYIYGEGPERNNLENLIRNLGLEGRVILCGREKNVLHKIKDASLFVLSSNYEGFPNALLEAVALGLPVISTDFPTGTAERLIDNSNGIIVPVNDEYKMSIAIKKIMLDETLRKKMRGNTLNIRNELNLDRIVSMWMKNIAQLV